MSMKNLDRHNRWRNKTVAFRVSPEEDEQLEIRQAVRPDETGLHYPAAAGKRRGTGRRMLY